MEESVRMTEDRDKWRKYVYGVANPPIEDGKRTEHTVLLTAELEESFFLFFVFRSTVRAGRGLGVCTRRRRGLRGVVRR